MSEHSGAVAGTSKPAAGAELRHGKARATAQNAAGTPDAGEFSALLMQLGAAAADSPGKTGVPLNEAATDSANAKPEAPQQDRPACEAALVLAQTLQLHKDVQQLTPPDAVAGLERGLSAMSRADAGRRDTDPAGFAGELDERAVDSSAASQTPEAALTQEAVAEWAQRKVEAGALQKTAATRVAQMEAKSELARAALDQHDQQKAAMHPGGGLIATDTRLAQTAWVAEFDRRSVQRPLDKLTEKKGGDEGVWGYQALAPGARADQISMPSAPLPASSGSLVAEQVNYWIGKDVHEAELTLDGLGLDAVGVSISLQGNEAHVSFRTDQAATRQVLEGAQIHLRELLESSGLVLSGVSVGSSGAEGSPAQQRKPYANARAAVTGVTQVQPAIQGLARVGPGMGGTVDYFV